MNASLNQLKVFYISAKLKNFTLAAEALFITQPGISKHIKYLEDQYNVRLFNRAGKRMSLTHAGEILFEYLVKIYHSTSHNRELLTLLGERVYLILIL